MGPLSGVRVVEMAGIGPAPFCAMLLADMGADVLRIDRTGPSGLGVDFPPAYDFLARGKRALALDLKAADDLAALRRLVGGADMLIEGFRPGVMERLGLGPEEFPENPRLVYGRMTGWGQDGPLAVAAGHDLNYIAISGALDAIGPAGGPPAIPLNLVGDFGGGSLYLALGLLAALAEARTTGRGRVVDAAIVDGAANLLTMHYALYQTGQWPGPRGTNLIDGGAPFYALYETSDGLLVSVAAIEPKFYRELVERMELDPASLPPQYDRGRWPELRASLASAFATRTRADWCDRLEGSDACFAPVLTLEEARAHPHNAARGNVLVSGDIAQPAPAPRFSGSARPVTPLTETDRAAALAAWGR